MFDPVQIPNSLRDMFKEKLIEFKNEPRLSDICNKLFKKYYTGTNTVKTKTEKLPETSEKEDPKKIVAKNIPDNSDANSNLTEYEKLILFDKKLTRGENKIGRYICSKNILFNELITN